MENTFERVRHIVADVLDKDIKTITPETSLTEDLLADSLHQVEIVMALEDVFCREFGEESLSLKTIQDIVDYIQR